MGYIVYCDTKELKTGQPTTFVSALNVLSYVVSLLDSIVHRHHDFLLIVVAIETMTLDGATPRQFNFLFTLDTNLKKMKVTLLPVYLGYCAKEFEGNFTSC